MRFGATTTGKTFRGERVALRRIPALLALAALGGAVTVFAEQEEPAGAQHRGEAVSVFRDIVVGPQEVRQGDVVCIGCSVRVEGRVAGDIVVIMGSLELEGVARHDVVCVLSEVRLGPGARIAHDFVNVLGRLDDAGAEVGGDRVHIPGFFWFPSARGALGMLGTLLAWRRLIGLSLTFVLLLIVVAFVPERIEAMSEAVPVRWPMAFLVGFVAYLTLFFFYSILLASLVGIPVALFVHGLLFPVFLALGMAGLFHHLGRRLGRAFGRELSLLAAVLLGFLPFALLLLLPWLVGGLSGLLLGLAFGLIFALCIKVPAFGLLLLTRAGGKRPPVPPLSPAVSAGEERS